MGAVLSADELLEAVGADEEDSGGLSNNHGMWVD